jgi:hypothetical protein
MAMVRVLPGTGMVFGPAPAPSPDNADERSNPSVSSLHEVGEPADHFGFPSRFRFRGLGR